MDTSGESLDGRRWVIVAAEVTLCDLVPVTPDFDDPLLEPGLDMSALHSLIDRIDADLPTRPDAPDTSLIAHEDVIVMADAQTMARFHQSGGDSIVDVAGTLEVLHLVERWRHLAFPPLSPRAKWQGGVYLMLPDGPWRPEPSDAAIGIRLRRALLSSGDRG